MTTAELIHLAKLRDRIAGYREAAQALLELADEEERELRHAKDAGVAAAEADVEWEAALKRHRKARAA